ncbi:MAG: capsular polysaccharide biosynthesis protein [Desulfovibrio sp.]|nr:capsular polysaccharide biosynthesis protein [Desulfovibrio sp.]
MPNAKPVFFSSKMPHEEIEGLLASELAKGRSLCIGWGRKPSGERARLEASKRGLAFCTVEDGFYRSLDLGAKGNVPPLSLVFDLEGVYYDASCPSALERLLEETGWETPALLRTAEWGMVAVRTHDLSKYNCQPPLAGDPWQGVQGPRVLVVDQTFGDASVRFGVGSTADAGQAVFAGMLEEVLARYPQEAVRVKIHPDVLCGKKRGYLADLARERGAVLIAESCSPVSLLRHADVVYTVSSQMGFDALLLGKDVVCFGMPFYAGWGATEDRCACPRRTRKRSVAEIFAAACILYARYWDPVRRRRCSVKDALRLLAEQRLRNERNRGLHCCVGFKLWKHPQAISYLQCTEGVRPRFCLTVQGAVRVARKRGGDVVVWSSKVTSEVQRLCDAMGVGLVRMEDGFLRSVGLGSDFRYPYSLVLDRKGIYYDPTRPSDLEDILNGMPERADRADLQARARKLVASIVAQGITKYDTGLGGRLEDVPKGRTVILVPGQVEDDASVRIGGAGIASNLELLRIVRQAEPEAFILYKPHPDVEKNGRRGAVADSEALRFCDRVVRGVQMGALLGQVDKVHTLTSLTGFEALLRGLPVVCWGGPFYAGWGLTEDHARLPRRTARLTRDDLAAGTLILYPSYYDWETGQFVTPEQACFRLAEHASGAEVAIPLRNVGFALRWYVRTSTRIKMWIRRKFGPPRV